MDGYVGGRLFDEWCGEKAGQRPYQARHAISPTAHQLPFSEILAAQQQHYCNS